MAALQCDAIRMRCDALCRVGRITHPKPPSDEFALESDGLESNSDEFGLKGDELESNSDELGLFSDELGHVSR